MSSSQKSVTVNNSVGLCGFVFLLFLGLKLAEVGQVAHWSWWWVTAPLWGPLALLVGFVLAVAAMILLFKLVRSLFGGTGAKGTKLKFDYKAVRPEASPKQPDRDEEANRILNGQK